MSLAELPPLSTLPPTAEPPVVLGYERNTVPDSMLRDHGIDVVAIPGSELGRGRGGSRCMTCTIERDGI